MKAKLLILIATVVISSCGGVRTFHEYARAGDTVAIAVGMKPTFKSDNVTVTITPSSGPQIVIPANDSSIRAVVNFYPDPISNMNVSREINEDTTPFALTYGHTVLDASTEKDKDYYVTTVFLDLPTTLPTGLTQVDVSDSASATHTATLDVIPGTGMPNTFNAEIPSIGANFLLQDEMFQSLERSSHTEVAFTTTSVIPHAIEINFTHDPDVTVGGSGKALVVNPIGYKKNIHWEDDGINLKVILMEGKSGTIDHIKDFKFYIAGTITNLTFSSLSSYDSNGNAVSGVNSTLTLY